MIEYETVINFLSEYEQIYIHGNKINLRCPLCGDSKKNKRKRRMWVTWNIDGTSMYNCFNCGSSGTLVELYSQLKSISIAESIKILNSSVKFDELNKNVFETKNIENTKQKNDTQSFNNILDDCISFNNNVDGYLDKQYKEKLLDFIRKRQIPKEYNIFIANKGDYQGRIIIPIYYNDNIVYFQGRSLIENDDLKYKNIDVEKSSIIMNIDKFDKDKNIIITEGIIDAMMIEHNQGTCVLGGSISDDFINKILKYTNKNVIIANDNDKRGNDERIKLINNSKHGKILKYFKLPNKIKDLNEFKIKHKISNMYKYVTENSIDYWTYLLTK